MPAEILAAIAQDRARFSAPDLWRKLVATWLAPKGGPPVPFATQAAVYDHVFAAWDEAAQGPRPAWSPSPQEAAATNIGRLMAARGFASYADLYRFSITDREGFWSSAIERLGLDFDRPYDRVLDSSGGPESPRWLPGARFNLVKSCLAGPPEAPAIIAGSPSGDDRRIGYGELCSEVARVAAALKAAGWKPGDALAIDMSMTAESVFIYLGIVAAGMVVVSIADALAPAEVATRLRIAKAVGIFTALDVERGGKRLPLYRKLLGIDPPKAVVLGAAPADLRPGDLSWEVFLAGGGNAPLEVVVGEAQTPTNILFSSGTTGEPKAIPWTQLAPIKSAVDGALHLDIRSGDVVAWPTNLGWMMGPWLIYASLLNRATLALFSDVPTGRPFGEFVSRARVNVLGLVPSIVKAWRTDDRMVGLDWSSMKCFGSTGEASNPTDYLYLMMLAGYRPVIEYCGGTEIGGGYLTGSLVQPQSPAAFSTPALGSELVILDESGQPAANGEVFLVPPTLGYSESLLNRDHHQVYFERTPPGPAGQLLRRHGDQIERLAGGYFRALGRVDDTMNLGGIKVSSAEIERTVETVPSVVRTAAIAVSPPGGGPSELVIFAVLKPEAAARNVSAEMQAAIKEHLNPLFRIREVVPVETLPVTASNKVMRRELRDRYAHRTP